MIDHLLGRPSTAYKRSQVLLVILFWTLAIARGNKNGPPPVRRISGRLKGKLTPWQVLAATLTCLYAVKNADSLLGLQAPEPLAKLYSRDFYRATWMAVALDTGFASAMHVKPKWLRDILSMLFSGYYLFFANEADEKLRKYRAVCTVEFLRTTWEKTNNPFIRLITSHTRPKLGIKRRIVLPRPTGSPYSKPIIGWLYFDGTEDELSKCRNLILDIPGGGFVCMAPNHHDERLHHWAKRKGWAILALDYAKAPEYPYPYAVHECYDVYRLLHDTRGSVIGTRAGDLRIVLSGDSAGANIGAAMVIKLLETPAATRPPMPVSIIWTYPCLDFNFTSFMPPEHLRILRQESSAGLRSIAEQKDHLKHQSPLSVVEDNAPPRHHKRKKSWSKSFSKLPSMLSASLKSPGGTPYSVTGNNKRLPSTTVLSGTPLSMPPAGELPPSLPTPGLSKDVHLDDGDEADVDGEGDDGPRHEREMTLSERVQYWNPDRDYAELGAEDQFSPVATKQSRQSVLGTRLTMTSRTGFFNDRIISPSMMRAMAICYVGPRNSPDLSKNYYISPILTPAKLLAQFPPVYLLCGERDPFSDDTLIFSGRLRDAKLEKKAELQAKYNKYGEGLRMSSAKDATRDPILDEDEDDWVTMRFIEGWSHGFMQMVTLLPKVTHFFDLTADWAALSFAKQETSSYATSIQANGMERVPTFGQESQSEKEEDVLSFVPRRRGSNRSSSPALSPGLRAQWQQQQQQQQQQQDESGQSSSSAQLSSSSILSDGAASGITPPTSNASSSISKEKRARRPSPGENSTSNTKGGPIRRVLQEEADTTGQAFVATKKRASSFSESPAYKTVELGMAEGGVAPARRSSDLAENKVAAAAFVEAQDILKRRREDAVAGLGSAVLSSDSDEEGKANLIKH